MSKKKIDKAKIRELYSRLIKIKEFLGSDKNNPRDNVANNYSNIVTKLEKIIGETLDDFKLPPNGYMTFSNGAIFYSHSIIEPKAIELSGLLEGKFLHLAEQGLSSDEKIYRTVKNFVTNNKLMTGIIVGLIVAFLVWILGW